MTRVLLAEDEPLVREALAAMLQGDGHDLVTAASAMSAVATVPSAIFAAVNLKWAWSTCGLPSKAFLYRRI